MSTPSLAGQPPNIELTALQSAVILVAMDLENDRWVGAAYHLRKKHFPDLPWDEVPTRPVTTHAGWVALFKAHRGSFPPLPGHVAHPARPITISIRPDQTTAS